MDELTANKIKSLCYNHYKKHLTKNGKPKNGCEWTVMAAVVMMIKDANNMKVVSMGTGTKCIGKNFLCRKGHIVNDCHAEIIARRSFLYFLYNELENVMACKKSIFIVEGEKFKLLSDIVFHFFTTAIPCGDASIIPKSFLPNSDESACLENVGETIDPIHKKRFLDDEDELTLTKKFKVDKFYSDGSNDLNDIYRTGAKCLNSEDKHLAGKDYHVVGVLRTKPGRGDKTKSLSCSDKLCKWNVVGIQGALLMHFLAEPIYLKSYIVNSFNFDESAFVRASYSRIENKPILPEKYCLNKFNVFHLPGDDFVHSRKLGSNLKPSPTSICWHLNENTEFQQNVLTKGHLLGLTKKDKSLGKCSYIAKSSLFQKFYHLKNTYCEKYPESNLNDLSVSSYFEYKQASNIYQVAKNSFKKTSFYNWPCTDPNFYCFVAQ